MSDAWAFIHPGAVETVGTSYTFSVSEGLLLSYLNVSVPEEVSNTVYIVCAHAVEGITIAATSMSVAASHLNCLVCILHVIILLLFFILNIQVYR